MRRRWQSLQAAPFWVRWPAKALLFLVVFVLVLYPDPRILKRHLQHLRDLEGLVRLTSPQLEEVLEELDGFLARRRVAGKPEDLIRGVQAFVYQRIPYAWDWDNWGVADYIPTAGEVLERGREDCDGRAVLAVALLRAKGVQAELAGDPRHLWVHTPTGDCMNPLGEPVFRQTPTGTKVQWLRLIDAGPLAFGVSVFPLGRELVILLTAWLLLLPPKMPRGAIVATALLMLEALVILRLAGADARAPQYGGIAWAGLHLLAAAWLLVRFRPRSS